MAHNLPYIFTMAAVIYLIRMLPLTLIRGPIRNRFVRSFLFYVPYVTLTVMTFPAILGASASPVSGAAALVLGAALAWRGARLFPVAIACCGAVYLLERLL